MVSMLHFKQKIFTSQIFNEMMIMFFPVKASAKTSQNIRESCLLTLSLDKNKLKYFSFPES